MKTDNIQIIWGLGLDNKLTQVLAFHVVLLNHLHQVENDLPSVKEGIGIGLSSLGSVKSTMSDHSCELSMTFFEHFIRLLFT